MQSNDDRRPTPPRPDDGGSHFVLAEWVDDGESSAARPIAPLHVHYGDDEAWYVLEGTLGFICGDERLEAPAGSGVLVAAGLAHSFWNAGGVRCRYLIVLTPRLAALIDALHIDALHIDALHEPGALDDLRVDDLRGLFARFDSELLA